MSLYQCSDLSFQVLQRIKPDRKRSSSCHQRLKRVKIRIILRLLQRLCLHPPLPSLTTRLLQPIKTWQRGGESLALGDEPLDVGEAELGVGDQARTCSLLPAVQAQPEVIEVGKVSSLLLSLSNLSPASLDRPRSTEG